MSLVASTDSQAIMDKWYLNCLDNEGAYMCILSPHVFEPQLSKNLFHLILPFCPVLAMTLDLDDAGACPHKKGTCYLNEDSLVTVMHWTYSQKVGTCRISEGHLR